MKTETNTTHENITISIKELQELIYKAYMEGLKEGMGKNIIPQ